MRVSRRLGLGLGLVQVLAWATTYYLPAIVAGPVSEDLGYSRAAVLGAFSWALIVGGLLSPLAGAWIERTGGRTVLVVGVLLQAAGLAVLGGLPSLWGWYLGWTVIGGGMAFALYDAAFATAGRHLGAGARPVILGITMIGGFASTLGWPLGSWLFDAIGWRLTAFVYAGVQVALNLPIVLATVPARAPASEPRPGAEHARAPPVGGGRTLALLGVYFTVRSFIAGVVTVHALILLTGLGMSQGAAVAAAALVGPAQVGARVLDWSFGRYATPLLTGRLGALLLPVGLLAPLAGLPGVALTLAYGLSNGILTVSRGTLPLFLLGPEGYATRLGQLALPALIAQAIAPTITAPLLGVWPAAHILTTMAGLAALAGLCLAPLRPRAGNAGPGLQ